MNVIASISDLRERLNADRRSGKSIGFVPTMGALHAGHARLIEECRRHSDVVVVSVFVNPLQFNRKDDLDKYPRTLEGDVRLCTSLAADIVFAPTASAMYPGDQLTFVDVPALTETLCGAFRPGHFRGVATVVAKLLNVVQPDAAYFGEKDAQQLAVIRRMVRDLNMPVTIVPVPTVREADGLALSSRNRLLTESERRAAPVLYKALKTAQSLVAEGHHSAAAIRQLVLPILDPARVEYFEIVDPETMRPVETIAGKVLIAGAIWLGATRLIDNVTAAPLPGQG